MLVIHVISTEDTKMFKCLYTGIDAKVLINPTKEDAIRAIYEDGCGKTHFFRCGMKAALTKYFDFSNIFSIFVQKVSLVTI